MCFFYIEEKIGGQNSAGMRYRVSWSRVYLSGGPPTPPSFVLFMDPASYYFRHFFVARCWLFLRLAPVIIL